MESNETQTELIMITLLKWILAALAAAFLWLVGKYTAEYFGYPSYKK